MPSIVQQDPEVAVGKKRRWEDAAGDSGKSVHLQQIHAKMSSPKAFPSQFDYILPQTHQLPLTRVLKSVKRQRLDRTQSSPLPFSLSSRANLNTPGSISPGESPDQHDPQPYLPIQEHHQTPTGAWSYQIKPQTQKKDLNPCHICHRRPTLLSELDQYTSCEGCGERTCWICVRECAGYSISPHTVGGLGRRPWNERTVPEQDTAEEIMIDADDHSQEYTLERMGTAKWDDRHRGMVCSRCCVEKGSDGEVWCLGCLRNESGGLD